MTDRMAKLDRLLALGIWDVSNGIDGVMMPGKECTVHVTTA